MHLKNIKIGTHLRLSFAAVIILVATMGVVSYFQTKQVHDQTVKLYQHPFQVQMAIGNLRSDILAIHRDMKDMVISSEQNEINLCLNRIDINESDAFDQIATLHKLYLGPRSDIDTVKLDFVIWNSLRAETIRLLREGKTEEAGNRTKLNGIAGKKVEEILTAIAVIDNFAKNKANEFYTNSKIEYSTLTLQLVALIFGVLILILLVNYFLYQNIRTPLTELTHASNRFNEGDYSARSSFTSKNEFGILSNSFNELVINIESNLNLNKSVADLSELMIAEDDPQKFFNSFLVAVSTFTQAQIAAIYLLNEDKNSFEHAGSVGLGVSARQSFSSKNTEGELGAAVLTGKIQHIKNISEETRFEFNTVNGTFIPREIITVPVSDGNETIAVIALSTLGKFNELTFQLLDKIMVTFSTRLTGMLAFQKIREFTEILEIQKEALGKASYYNRGLIEASIDSLITIAPNGIITDANSSTEAFLGLTREELIGTDVTGYFTEPHLAKAGYQKVFQEGIVRDYELMMRSKSGKEIPVIYNASVYRDNKGEVIGILAAARDITERKMAEQELKRLNIELTQRSEKLALANSELEAQKTELSSQSTELISQNMELEMQKNQLDEASRLKTIFLSNMSHELRTPLNSVIALSGVLSRRLSTLIPEEEHSYLEIIERNGKHLLDLINDILDISRIEAGKEEVEITDFNLNAAVNEVVRMIHPQAKAKDIGLNHLNPEQHIAITSDAVKIRHIVQNLLGNAIKFTEQGKVEIEVSLNKGDVSVKVTDTGIGISAQNQLHIFDEFRQADSGTSRKFGGSGLGLAIAKKYARLLGGTITVESKIEEGAVFTVVLPQVYNADKIIERELTTSLSQNHLHPFVMPEKSNGMKTILLVEDSEPAIIQLKDILEESKFHIIVARNGQQALDIINFTIPDAIILDLMMPGVDGFEVLETVRGAEATANVPVLILTAKHITKEDLKFLKRNNIHQLIQKGNINRSELLNAVASMVILQPIESEKPTRALPIIDGKPKVLVVEDNPDNLITVKAILSDNFIVIEATDGKMGVEMAEQNIPDLILMDIQLPEMDGIAAFKAIRGHTKLQHIPIIALTASAMTNERETILAHGFDAYIAKPIYEPVFFKTIKEVIYGK
jgi:PAS domain S-box-containing protein